MLHWILPFPSLSPQDCDMMRWHTHDCVTLHGKGDFNAIEFTHQLSWEREMFKWSCSGYMSPFKAESFIQLLPEEAAREIQGVGGIWCKGSSPFLSGGAQARTWEQPQRAKSGAQTTASKETRPQTSNHKELEPANNLNEPGSRFFPRVSQ